MEKEPVTWKTWVGLGALVAVAVANIVNVVAVIRHQPVSIYATLTILAGTNVILWMGWWHRKKAAKLKTEIHGPATGRE